MDWSSIQIDVDLKREKISSSAGDTKPMEYLSMYGEHAASKSFTKLPQWLKDYFIWHKAERKKENAEYVVISCLENDRCGGFSDRLRDLPFLLLVASRMPRILCIYWSRPFQLDSYLIPTDTGIDWRCPEQFNALMNNTLGQESNQPLYTIYSLAGKKKDTGFGSSVSDHIESIKLSAVNQTYIGIRLFTKAWRHIDRALRLFNGQSYNTVMPEVVPFSHVDLTEHLFRVLFKPVPALALHVNNSMSRLGLREKEFSSVHVRGRYPAQTLIEHIGDAKVTRIADKAGGIKFLDRRINDYLTDIATNAIQCIHLLSPEIPIYFSSDMSDMTKAITSSVVTLKDGTLVRPVGLSRKDEILHVEGVGSRNSSFDDFLPLMEDLLIMGASKCVSHGIGSFGAFGASLNGNKCRALHQNHKGQSETCPNSLVDRRNMTITNDYLLKGEYAFGEGKLEYKSDVS